MKYNVKAYTKNEEDYTLFVEHTPTWERILGTPPELHIYQGSKNTWFEEGRKCSNHLQEKLSAFYTHIQETEKKFEANGRDIEVTKYSITDAPLRTLFSRTR